MRFSFAALTASTLLTGLLAACGSAPKAPEQASTSTPTTAPANSSAQAGGVDAGQANGRRTAPADGQATAQVAVAPGSLKDSVFFAFDDATVAADEAPVLQGQLQWLQAHPQAKVTLQGNTDERGGSEYNLALGQRRAEAVRKALLLLGAQGERVESISYGKEHPRATCHEESCWKDNRRVDTVAAGSSGTSAH